MFSDVEESTPNEFEQSSSSEEETVTVQRKSKTASVQDGDSKQAQMLALRKMLEDGLLSKKQFVQMLQSVLKQVAVVNKSNRQPQKRPRDEDHDSNAGNRFVSEVLGKKKKFRRAASPETAKIRKMIEYPIERRFQNECSKKHTPLFANIKPRRLNKDLFELACKSPLEEIYDNHSKDLKGVASGKLMHVIKWKVGKMKANPLPAKAHASDNFDFEKADAMLKTKLFSPKARRRHRDTYRRYHKKSKTSTRYCFLSLYHH